MKRRASWRRLRGTRAQKIVAYYAITIRILSSRFLDWEGAAAPARTPSRAGTAGEPEEIWQYGIFLGRSKRLALLNSPFEKLPY